MISNWGSKEKDSKSDVGFITKQAWHERITQKSEL